MTITLGDYRRLATCKRCNVPVIAFYDLTPEHQMLGVRAIGSDTSGLCAPCWTADRDSGIDPDYTPARERTPWGQFQLRPSHLRTSKPGARFRTEQPLKRTELPPVLPPEPAPKPEPRTRKAEPTPTMGPFIRGEWVAEALCAQTDPEAFFPEVGETSTPALRVCQACPVRQQCLEWALANNEIFGVWGGTTPNDRRKLRRARAGAA